MSLASEVITSFTPQVIFGMFGGFVGGVCAPVITGPLRRSKAGPGKHGTSSEKAPIKAKKWSFSA